MRFSVNRQGFYQHHRKELLAYPKKQLRKSGAGFTLIELLVSMAIMGILSTIFFTGLNNDRQRNAAKRAAEQLQIDFQDAQIKAQSGRVVPATTSRPSGYGVAFSTNNPASQSYIAFADGISGVIGSLSNQKYDDPSELQKKVVLAANLNVVQLLDKAGTPYLLMSIDYPVPAGSQAIITADAGSGDVPITTTATIVLKQTQLDICYSVTVDAATGTVARRELATAQCP